MSLLNPRSSTHAIKLLETDHREVDAMFEEFEKASTGPDQTEIVSRICKALAIHTELEERIFYPESRKVLQSDGQDQVDEAYVEHASLKGLIQRLDGMRANEPLFKAYVTVLKEYVQHHVKEEEKDYFPDVEKTSLDLEAIGQRMLVLKEQLMTQLRDEGSHRGVVRAKLIESQPLPQRAMKKAA
jgi:hemerythrin superfamily protein